MMIAFHFSWMMFAVVPVGAHPLIKGVPQRSVLKNLIIAQKLTREMRQILVAKLLERTTILLGLMFTDLLY